MLDNLKFEDYNYTYRESNKRGLNEKGPVCLKCKIGDETKMSDKLKIDEMRKSFGNKPFTSDELYRFYLEEEPNLKEMTFRGRVHRLKDENVIYSLKRGLYTAVRKNNFAPPINKQLKNLYKKIKAQFPYSEISIWDTSWLNDYMVHQPLTRNIIIEVDKDAVASVFSFSQESMKNVFLNPGKHEIETYMSTGQTNVIVKNLVAESPVETREDISIPRIEKIMVDLFVEEQLYVTYQGGELKNIYEAFFETFSINQSTLNRYATKRKVKERFLTFLKNKTEIDQNEIYI